MWNRYRNYIAGLAVVVVAVNIFEFVLKSCSIKSSGRPENTLSATPTIQKEGAA